MAGMTSLLIRLEDGAMIEARGVGKEGFAGAAALWAWRIRLRPQA
jgi:hypothetical protein